jgi:CheY-like chemotaxis protein
MPRIMVVDDEPDNTELMKIILSKHNFDVVTYNKPVTALEELEKGALPDLLILDMRMPELSGTDFCLEIRKNRKFDDLKIVFFTASNDLNQDLLRTYGVKGFIFKPFNINELIKQIDRYLADNTKVTWKITV